MIVDFAEVLPKLSRSIEQYPVYIETGTGMGQSIEAAVAAGFRCLYTVELSGARSREAAARLVRKGARIILKTDKHIIVETDSGQTVHFLINDSRLIFPRLLEILNIPVAVHLDAHFCRPGNIGDPPAVSGCFSLWDELDHLNAHNFPDIVSVDDMHTFGRDRPDLGKADRKIWESVTPERILEFSAQRVKSSFVYRDSFILEMTG